ncbi:hypothetical protein Tco_0972590 [Tanacetum coccineum]
MIKLRADVELKDTIMVAMPKHVDECPKNIVSNVEKNLKNPRHAAKGVHVGTKVVSTKIVDSDSKVEDVVDDHAVFMASTGLKHDTEIGYGTNSLLEQ